ncbi:MAG TPA: WD40 repeat domain-containing protein [Terriglobia bacterium]|nr:WD40 repeat domain-containing protein [Terriglobia bacterium]
MGERARAKRRFGFRRSGLLGIAILVVATLSGATLPSAVQVESVAGPSPQYVWENFFHSEGHLALRYSPVGAFSPDGSLLAVVSKSKIVLNNLSTREIGKVLHVQLQNISDIQIQSADSLPNGHLFVLANGLFRSKGKGAVIRSPELAFQWDPMKDQLAGKVDAIGQKGGFLPARYFPHFHDLCLYKESHFVLWDPVTGKSGEFMVPQLTQPPHFFQFSPDGKWLVLAQIEMNASPNPIVVAMQDHQFADVLAGHRGVVLSARFSQDNKKLVTACEDGTVRLWSVPDWKLVKTLTGHVGPVHWADFSPDGRWIASAGEDKTVRVWSAEDGKLVQVLRESPSSLVTLAFSPDGRYIAATSEKNVMVWRRHAAN